VKLADAGKTGAEATGCQHLDSILEEIHPSIDLPQLRSIEPTNEAARNQFAEDVARRNVVQSVRNIVEISQTIRKLVDEGRLAVVGAVYDVSSGKVEFLVKDAIGLPQSVNQSP
jgi:carbonic anhydrase/SulP family sulfate permease